MDVESVKGFRKDPFKTFVVRTTSGESHQMTRLEAVTLSPKGDLVILWP
jgi:hypothetical protein